MGRLAVDTRGRSGLGSGWTPSLVSQALLNGHLDQLILAQAAIQAVFLMPDGTLSAPSTDLRSHPLPPLTSATRGGTPWGGGSSKLESPVSRPKASWSLTGLLQENYVYQQGRLCFPLASSQSFFIQSCCHLNHPDTHSSTHLSIHSSSHQSVHLFHHPFHHSPICPFVYSPMCPSVYPSTHLPNHMCLFTQ